MPVDDGPRPGAQRAAAGGTAAMNSARSAWALPGQHDVVRPGCHRKRILSVVPIAAQPGPAPPSRSARRQVASHSTRSSTGRRHRCRRTRSGTGALPRAARPDVTPTPTHRGQHDRAGGRIRAPRSDTQFAAALPARRPTSTSSASLTQHGIHAGRNRQPLQQSRNSRASPSSIRIVATQARHQPDAGSAVHWWLVPYRHGLLLQPRRSSRPLEPVRRRALASPIPTAVRLRGRRAVAPDPIDSTEVQREPARFAIEYRIGAVGQRHVHPDSFWLSSFGS